MTRVGCPLPPFLVVCERTLTTDTENQLYHYPCPCGDRFEITIEQLRDGDDVARCPSCSLIILVIYDQDDFEEAEEEAEEDVPIAASSVQAIAV